MRPLLLDDPDTLAEVARVKAHARANHYYPGDTAGVPGDSPDFVAKLSTYRAVFTYTHDHGCMYRHLSVSVPGEKWPNPAASFAIANMFGFTGYDLANPSEPNEDWTLGSDKEARAITVVQVIWPHEYDAEGKACSAVEAS